MLAIEAEVAKPMGFFKKRESAPPDEALPFMPRDAADRFRREVAAAFAERGIEVQVHPDYVVDAEGREFGLHNAAVACWNDERGPTTWGEVVRVHVGRILTAVDDPGADAMTTEQVLANVYPRLTPVGALGSTPASYVVPFSDDVVEALNVDLPDSVLTLGDERVEAHGGRSVLRAAGIRNLLGVLPGLEVERMTSAEVSLVVATSESMFTASTVLVMPELLAQLHMEPAPLGVLVCMPFRHQIGLHAIRDASVVPSLNTMVRFALGGFQDGGGPLTPHVFWWRAGEFQQLTHLNDDGMSVNVTPEFQKVLEEACG